MAGSIITSTGSDPLDEWKSRLTWFGSAVLSVQLRLLLSGERVESRDGVLEISSYNMTGQAECVLTVRDPAGPYAAELVVRAADAADIQELGGTPDPRSSQPCPDRWRLVDDQGVVHWELFNCIVHTLRSRPNTPALQEGPGLGQ